MTPPNPAVQDAANLARESRAGTAFRESPLDTGAARALEIGGRLRHGPSERLVQAVFRKELEAQLGLSGALSRVDLAHTLMLVETGVIPPGPGRELLAALLELDAGPVDFQPDPARGDLYTNREAWLAARTSATGWLGAGRARREAITTAFLIRVREALLELAAGLAAAGLALTVRAREFRAALMADYTYLLAAQPTSFGHYLLGFAYPMLRDQERLRGLYGRIDQSPAGCGSTNGSRLPQDRARLAELLGFERLQVHARDAAWAADLPIEAMALLAAILVNLDRLAEDLQIFSTEEFALVELDDCHARASKIMPQKKNPFALAHVRGLANAMTGALAAAVATGRTPSGQPDNRLALYGAVPQAIDDTREALELMAEVAQCLAFREGQARARLVHSFAGSTDLAEVLTVECGLDFREAHRLVGHLVRVHLAEGGFGELAPEALAQAAAELGHYADLSAEGLENALDPLAALAARASPGGAAAAPMAAMLEECESGFTAAANWAGSARQRLAAADAALSAQVRAVMGG